MSKAKKAVKAALKVTAPVNPETTKPVEAVIPEVVLPVVEPIEVVAPVAPVVVSPAETKKAEVITLHQVATAIVVANPDLLVQPTASTGYRILGTLLNTQENWKKGLFFVINCNAKGFRIELQLYSCKKGAHLAEYAKRFQQFGGKDVGENPENLTEYTAFGLAGRVRMLLPSAQGIEKIVENATKFINLVKAEVEVVRALVVLDPPKAKKPAAAPVVVSPADTTAPVAPVVPASETAQAADPGAEDLAAAPAPAAEAGSTEAPAAE